jgi:hypothetical protein
MLYIIQKANVAFNIVESVNHRWFINGTDKKTDEDAIAPPLDLSCTASVLQSPNFSAMSRAQKFGYAMRTLKQMADIMSECGGMQFAE